MIRIGITHGDINGISYEVILKTLEEPHVFDVCIPIIYGSSKIAGFHRKALNINNVNIKVINSPDEAIPGAVNIVNCINEELKVEYGNSTAQAGEAAYAALERCTKDFSEGLIHAIVTGPINKNNIHSANFNFPGHTEYIEERLGKGRKSLMILAHERVKVALATAHVPISMVPSMITPELLTQKIETFNLSLKTDFSIQKPMIAVLGLNPHAGDGGVLGKEDMEIILPTIQELNKKGILCYGPYPADGFFGSGNFAKFDGILAMYHDQGLAPFKLLAMEDGVNITAGLPVVRTSPAHGTAYDIAGQGIASESSFRSALFMAIDVVNSRKQYKEMRANPLRKQFFERGSDADVSTLISSSSNE